MPYYFYLASCSDGSLYCGSCMDLEAREAKHNEGKGAKYTRGRRPIRFVYSEEFGTLAEARRREAEVKTWSRSEKNILILRKHSVSSTSFIPPPIVAEYAKEGLRLREEFGRGGTDVGLARASELSRQMPLTKNDVRRMYSFFARHEVDKRGRNFGNMHNPSNGYIAWMLWGGDPAKEWVTELRNAILREG